MAASHPTSAATSDATLTRGTLAVRAGIASAAVRLFLERGFVETTIDDIAFEAGVSRRTYFRYFSSKDEAILVFLAVTWEQVLTQFEARPDDEPTLTALREAMRAVLVEVVEESPMGRALTKLVYDTPSLRARALAQQADVTSALAGAIARRWGYDQPDLKADLIASFAGSILDTATREWLADEDGTLLDHLDRVFEVVRDVRTARTAESRGAEPPVAESHATERGPEASR